MRFARYAYPPNRLGYCGPADHGALLEYASACVTDNGLTALAQGFAGAWPYLELIAGAAHRDPLDPAVVEAYWIGNSLLTAVRPAWLAASLDDRFAMRLGTNRSLLGRLAASGGVPHHSFHVLAVSPWIGLLRAGFIEQPLETIDKCRIRTGIVERVDNGRAEIVTDRMRWDGDRLACGASTIESFLVADRGYGLAGPLTPGDRVAVHWDWVCERLSTRQVANVDHYTHLTLQLVNSLPSVELGSALAR